MPSQTQATGEMQEKLRHLEREEGRLWRVSLFFLTLVGTGLAAASWQNLATFSQHLEAVPIGTIVVCVLFAVYAASKRRQIAELKGVVQGIKEREQAPPSEEQLGRLVEVISASQRGYRELIDSLDTVVLGISLQGNIQTLNRCVAELLQQPFNAIAGRNLDEFLSEPTRAEADRAVARFLERRNWAGVVRIRLKHELAPRYFDCVLHPILKDGDVTGISVLAQDITQQKERETRFTELFESLQEGVYFTTPDGRLRDCNEALVRMLGYGTKEELLQVPVPNLYVDPEQRLEQMRELERSVVLRCRELRLRRKDGSTVICLDSVRAILDPTGRPVQYQGALFDITEQRQIEERLHDEEEFRRRLVESFPDLIVVLDREGRYKFISPRVRELLGYEPESFVGRSIIADDIPAATEFQRLFHSIVTGKQVYETAEYAAQHREGAWRTLRASAGPMYDADGEVSGIIASVRDVTALKQLEQQLIQNERLAAMGQMIDGFAHELNNPLTAIIGSVELLEASGSDAATTRRYDLLKQQARRAAEVVQNLLFFSRPPAPGNAPLSVSELVQRSLQLHEHSLRAAGVSVDFVPDLSLPPVVGDPQQLMQVFLNLVINAEQAMREIQQRGTLKIRMGRNQERVWISFQDDGPGISAEAMPKIFDPFFTTKRPGRGTGLGLSVATSILKKYDGTIEAKPAPEHGAVFTVVLPTVKAAAYAMKMGTS